MKRVFLSLTLLTSLMLFSCTTYVTVTEDPYVKATVVKYEDSHKVIEGDLRNQRVCYTRNIKGKEKGPITVELDFYGMAHIISKFAGDDLDETGYVLIDNTSFPVKLADRKNNKNAMLHGSIEESGYMFGPNFSSDGHVSLRSTTMCRLRGKFTMTPDMERALAGAKKMSIRVSAGGSPIIVKPSGGQLDMIKELAAFTPGLK